MLKRYLEATEPSPKWIDGMAFSDIIRTVFERGLLRSFWDVWKDYFSESTLPFKFDIADWATISGPLKQGIQKEAIIIQEGVGC